MPSTTEYAPYALLTDPARFGLVSTSVSGALGSTVARHHPDRNSSRATLFLHGAAGSWTTWTPVLQAARDSDRDLGDIVLFDLPGWGDGDLHESPQARTIDTVCELVRDAAIRLGYTEWVVVGHSMGGFIALHMAATWPDSVRAVVTISGTTWSVIESVEHPVHRFSTLPGFTTLWQVMRLLAGLGRAGRSFVRGLRALRLLRPAVAPLFRHAWRIDRTVIDSLAEEIRPRSFDAAAGITRGYDTGAWAHIGCPVTALKGDRDVFVRDDDLEKLHAVLPASRTFVVEDCGHFANVERPFAVLELIPSSPRTARGSAPRRRSRASGAARAAEAQRR